jgi:hypothetical protein
MLEQAGQEDLRVQAMQLRAALLLELGDPSALGALAEYCRSAEELGYPRARWNALTRRATLASLTGELDQAADLLAEGLALGEQIGEPDSLGAAGTSVVVLGRLADVAGLDTARLAAVTRALRADADVFGRRGDPLVLALGLLASGDTAGAARAVAGYPLDDLPGSHDAEPLVFAASVFAAVGSPEQRAHAYAALEPLAGTGSVVGRCGGLPGAGGPGAGRAGRGPRAAGRGRWALPVGSPVRAGARCPAVGTRGRGPHAGRRRLPARRPRLAAAVRRPGGRGSRRQGDA